MESKRFRPASPTQSTVLKMSRVFLLYHSIPSNAIICKSLSLRMTELQLSDVNLNARRAKLRKWLLLHHSIAPTSTHTNHFLYFPAFAEFPLRIVSYRASAELGQPIHDSTRKIWNARRPFPSSPLSCFFVLPPFIPFFHQSSSHILPLISSPRFLSA